MNMQRLRSLCSTRMRNRLIAEKLEWFSMSEHFLSILSAWKFPNSRNKMVDHKASTNDRDMIRKAVYCANGVRKNPSFRGMFGRTKALIGTVLWRYHRPSRYHPELNGDLGLLRTIKPRMRFGLFPTTAQGNPS